MFYFMKRKDYDLTVKPVPVPQSAHHPPPPHGGDVLPKHEFTIGY